MREGLSGAREDPFEHQWVITEEYGWRSFADGEAELTKWVVDRAWTTGDGPGTISDAAVLWLRELSLIHI